LTIALEFAPSRGELLRRPGRSGRVGGNAFHAIRISMPDAPPPSAANLIDDPRAPEIFVDGVCGFFLHNGNLRLAFEASRADHAHNPAPIGRYVVARIVMPAAGARALAVGLFDFLKQMGLEPGRIAPSVTLQKSVPDSPPPAQPTPPKPGLEFIELPGAPDLFADGATGFFLHNGVLRITLETQHFDHSGTHAPAIRALAGRIAMPAAAASALAVNLFDFLKKMGIDPASVSTVPTMQ
jgi:hypothetical protein